MPSVKLIIQPDHGVGPVLSAIEDAKKTIELTIFRFDRKDIEAALRAAASRGVKVSALVAYANRGGEKLLRNLELRFLEAGMIVARTANDLTRYHNKLMIIDRRVLYVLAFNFTHLDMERSRSFGIATQNVELVKEAVKLFEADCTRTEYTAGHSSFIVSPVNARTELGSFIKRARHELLIYDPEVSDDEMLMLVKERVRAGVNVRIIGYAKAGDLRSTELDRHRLHTRTIVSDRHHAFIGSQSLRATELDRRREVGIIVREPRIVKSLVAIFESDWDGIDSEWDQKKGAGKRAEIPEADSNTVAEVLTKELRPIAATVTRTVKKVIANAGDDLLHDEKVKDTVKKVVKGVVKDAVKEVAREAENGKRARAQLARNHAGKTRLEKLA